MNCMGEIVHCYSPTFAAFAPLREIFRVSVAALLRCVLAGNGVFLSDKLEPAVHVEQLAGHEIALRRS